jgi:hypothetical protein
MSYISSANQALSHSLERKVITSAAGRAMQTQVWKEITAELVAKAPETSAFLQ